MIKSKIKKILKIGNITYCPVTYNGKDEMLKDKVILVTGGGSGIGEAIAETIVRHGGKVIIVGRNQSKLINVVDKIGSPNCNYKVYDVTRNEGDIELYESLEAEFGEKINCIVNNAGVFMDVAPEQLTVDIFDKTINVNLKAPMFLTVGFIKYCKKYNISGNTVMISSNRGLFGDYGPYGASKSALINFTKGIGREYSGKDFRINAIAPGMTASNINGVDYNDNMYTNSARGKRVISPYEIAETVLFLLSDNSKCIQGAVIPCDEGDHLR